MNRKENILDSAERLVRSRGFDAFSYADIEKDVGIRKASIHHHFASKSDLALALMQRYGAKFDEVISTIEAEEEKAGGRLLNYLDLYRKALSQGDTLCLCVAFSAGCDSLSPAVLTKLNEFHDQSVEWLKGVFALGKQDGSIRNVVDPGMDAISCLAMVEGAQLIARAAVNITRFDAVVAGLRARIN